MSKTDAYKRALVAAHAGYCIDFSSWLQLEEWQKAHAEKILMSSDYPVELRKFLGIGQHEDPVLMLVGDQINPNTAISNRAFSSPSHASAYLHRVLDMVPKLKRNIYLTNFTKNLDGDPRSDISILTEEVKMVQPEHIISFNKKNTEMMEVHSISATYVEHPQYWRRFHHKKTVEYKDKIFQDVLHLT